MAKRKKKVRIWAPRKISEKLKPPKIPENKGFYSALEDGDGEGNTDLDNDVRQLLLDNPDMNANTLLNTLKSKGYKIVSETDSSSGFPQVTRAQRNKKEAKKLYDLNNGLSIRTSNLKENKAKNDGIGPTQFKVTLIEEGMGNMHDAYYYSRSAIDSCPQVFEGKKIFADHPTPSEEEDRPERSVRDILGYFSDVHVLEDADGRSSCVANVHMMDEKDTAWARGLMRHAIEFAKKYPDKEFVGLSINAQGEADESSIEDLISTCPKSVIPKLNEAKEYGIETVLVVSKITDAVSTDLVTEAGAGGKVNSIIEGRKPMTKEQAKKALKEAWDKLKKLKESKSKKSILLNAAAKVFEAKRVLKEVDDDVEKREMDGEPEGEEQDLELIKKLMDKHMGEADDNGEYPDGQKERYERYAKQAYQAAKKMGYDEEGRMQMADYGMQLLKDMDMEEANDNDDDEVSTEANPDPDPNKNKDAGSHPASESEAKLAGRLAFLENKIKKGELKDHIEKMLEDSGQPNAITKKFRQFVFNKEGEVSAKSTADVDRLWKVFMEGQDSGGRQESGLFINVEKRPVKETGIDSSLGSFADCVR